MGIEIRDNTKGGLLDDDDKAKEGLIGQSHRVLRLDPVQKFVIHQISRFCYLPSILISLFAIYLNFSICLFFYSLRIFLKYIVYMQQDCQMICQLDIVKTI